MNEDDPIDLSSLRRERVPTDAQREATLAALRTPARAPSPTPAPAPTRAPSRARRWRALAVAASLAAVAGGGFLAGRTSAAAPAYDYMLVLHDTPAMSALPRNELAARVDEYRQWMRGINRDGLSMTGDELGDVRTLIMPAGERTLSLGHAGGIGGFFLLGARSQAQALAVARRCPHVRHGGTVELRTLVRH
jgi:hypothetical protein